jgi:hypothetical protein
MKKSRFKPAVTDNKNLTLMDSVGSDIGFKLKKLVEDNLKAKIREAQSDPRVQEATKKYATV